MLEWLRANGCEWDEMMCAEAAGCGHLEVLKWRREHGCPWNWRTLDFAVKRQQAEVARWALDNGCEKGAARLNRLFPRYS